MKCENCGADVGTDFSFCTTCGNPINQPKTIKKSCKKKKRIILFTIILSLIIVVIGVGISSSVKRKTNKPRHVDFSNIEIGDYVTFGVFEQDDEEKNGKELIEWEVLEIRDDKALLLSKYGLDCMVFNSEGWNTNWADSEVRSWLNGTFYKKSFNDEEKEHIIKSEITTIFFPSEDNWAFEKTEDCVFILNSDELDIYYPGQYILPQNDSDWLRKNKKYDAKPTKYCLNNYYDTYCNEYWWLRSGLPESSNWGEGSCVLAAGPNGIIEEIAVHCSKLVRPAIWVKIDKEKNLSEEN